MLATFRNRLRSWLTTHPRVFVGILLCSATVAWGTVGSAQWLSQDLIRRLPDRNGLAEVGNMSQATTIFDMNNRPVFTIFKEQRIEIPLEQVSPAFIKAILATEDQRFFEHRGIDVVRVAAAALANVKSGRASQGGSTITQQLARQAFLSSNKTMRRKLTETILAARLERMYSKREILELYLNKIYFGDGLYGVQAASLGYFAKPASDLDVAEAAVLAGVVKSPSVYAPTISLDRAVSRRNVVLKAMLDAGAISADAYERARGTPLQIKNGLNQHESFGLYFKEYVRQELVERFGWERVYQGGLRVFTTLDTDAQRAAEDIVEKAVSGLDTRRAQWIARRVAATKAATRLEPQRLEAALLSVEPNTGFIRAMVGGRDFWKSRWNRALQARRQPGSAFKPIVYAVALEQGYTPATLIDHLDDPIPTPQGGWTPEDEHVTAPAISLRAALRTSSNRAAVRMLDQVGIGRTVQFAQSMGIGHVPSVPSLALGSGEVTLESLVTAYMPFAAGGYSRPPTGIRRVEDADGSVLYEAERNPRRVISDTTAFLMADMLQDVINSGTAARARAEGFRLPAAGKTGTTNDFADAWFIGFTPKLLTGVWIGLDRPATILPNGFAGDIAVPVWARFMKVATRNDRPEWYVPPSNVVRVPVCRLSGLRAGIGCDRVPVVNGLGDTEYQSSIYNEYFVIGTEPQVECQAHQSLILDHLIASGTAGIEPPPPPDPVSSADTVRPTIPPDPPPPGTQAQPPQIPPGGPAATEEPTSKRRSWIARVFGFGRGEKKPEKKK